MGSLYSSLIINISLLVFIATILTRISFVKQVLSEGHRSKSADRIALGIIFGMFCIFSTCTGVKVAGAIQNTRVLGALAGGMLGGPTVGMSAAVIGAVHRFFYDTQGFTSFPCALSTLFEGVMGSVVWYICKKKDLKQNAVSLFCITAFSEACQMGIILLVSRPFSEALALVEIIALPMIIINSCGMVLFFSVFREVFMKQDLLAADKIRLALNIADYCMPYFRKNEISQDDYDKITEGIRKFSDCIGVVILSSDKKTALNRTNLEVPGELLESIDQRCVHYACKKKSDVNFDRLGKYLTIGTKMTLGNEIWSYLVLYFPFRVESVQSEINFIEGLAKFFSTSYGMSQIEHQKKLREQAEFKALQSQVNPHFLFNSLNTITCFCREKPERARELLIALSVYFRNTLNSSSAYMIGVDQELEQVRAYLMLEEARFEERLTVEVDFPEDIDVEVPKLILQPIVENAVKHGAMKRAQGKVQISGGWQERGFVITVEDNGPGIPSGVLRGFYDKNITGRYGLLNVDARLRSIYGESYALSIETGDQGTVVSMTIPKQKI